ncbi:MAG: hypothetical protein ACTTJI_07490, partial [Capnocytophaga sp.]
MRTKKLYEARSRFFGILLFFCVSMFVSSLWAQTFQPIPTQTFACGNPPFNITAQVSGTSGTVNYEMYFNGVHYRTQVNNPTFTLTAPGIYRLKVTNGAWAQTHSFWALGAPPLFARAIVVKQVGCETGANASKGLVRIMNPFSERPAGGFEYSFDNKATWTTNNERWMSPGNYKLYARTTGNNCDFYEMTVAVLKPKFEATVQSLCNGTGVISIKATGLETLDGDTYQATYSLDGGTAQTSPVFNNVSAGIHTITATATRPQTTAWKTIFLETFQEGNFVQPNCSISKYYYYETGSAANVEYDGNGNPKTVGSQPGAMNDGEYYLKYIPYSSTTNETYPSHIRKLVPSKFPRMLYIPKYASTTEIHSPAIYTAGIDVLPNEEMRWTFDAFNMIKTTNPYIADATNPNLQVRIYATLEDAEANNNNYLYESTPYRVPKNVNENYWYILEGDVPAAKIGNRNKVYFQIRNLTVSLNGNDLVLDNIRLIQKQTDCAHTFTEKIAVNVTAQVPVFSPIMTYNCGSNTANLTVTSTIATGFTYSYKLDNGAFQTSNAFSNLSVGVHTITVSYKYTTASNTVVLFQDDFGSGVVPMKTPYMNNYTYFEGFTGKKAKAANGSERGLWPDNGNGGDIPSKIQNQEYTVLSKNFGDYDMIEHDNIIYPKDKSGDPYGRSLLVFQNNYHAGNFVIYEREFEVIPHREVRYSLDAFNIIKAGYAGMNAAENPTIRVEILDTNGTVLQMNTTGNLPHSSNENQWVGVGTYTLPAATVGARTKLKIRVSNSNATAGMSTGYAIDNIIAVQDAMIAPCTTSLTVTVAPKVTQAFAGVTKLIGCGASANANKAEVTIANVEGGSGNYEYSFDGITWTASNTGWLSAGTHTVSVRATGTGSSCPYDMSVTVPAALAQPTIKTEVFYGCDGRPILKVGVEDPDPALNYLYKLDGGAFTTTYIFNNIATGTHQVSVQYEYRTITSADIVFKDDFGHKNAATPDRSIRSPHINKAYFFENFTGTQVNGNGTTRVGNTTTDGCYMITTPADSGGNNYRDFDKDPNGRVFWVNIGNVLGASGAVLYQRQLPNIKPGRDIVFSISAYNTIRSSAPTLADPIISIDLYKNLSDIAAHSPFFTSGQITIPKNTHPDDWHTYSYQVSPGANTSFYFVIRSYSTETNGNDLALDNLILSQMPAACGQVVSATTNVTTNPVGVPTFNANISNCSNTNSTITWVASPTTGYTYTYTIQGGTATSSNVFNGLATGTYTFTVNYQSTASKVLVFNETFGEGTTPIRTPYIDQAMPFFGTALVGTDGYSVLSHLQLINGFNSTAHYSPKDYEQKTDGRSMILINNGTYPVPFIAYKREIQVVPNADVSYSVGAFNLVKSSYASPNDPSVRIQLYATEADIAANNPLKANTAQTIAKAISDSDWKTVSGTLAGTVLGNRNKVWVVVHSMSNAGAGNDLALDGVRVFQSAPLCQTTLTATVANQVQKAFAGVTKLIGCGTAAEAGKAEVTIANVEGGSGTYEYSFDNGLSWVATNVGWLPAGTHTVSVRDGISKSCPYNMSVTVPAALAQPTIKTEVFYACDGKAILNVGVENPNPELKYLYSLDGAAYTTTYLYTNVASGTHQVSVQYEHRSVPSPVMLLKETFGSGADKCLDTGVSSLTCDVFKPGRTNVPSQGAYGIISENSNYLKQGGLPPSCTSIWVPVKDHTSSGTDPQGRFFMADAKTISPNGDLFYRKEVKNITPHSEIKYEFYILNLFNKDKELHPIHHNRHASKPNIKVQLVANNGAVIASSEIGEVDNSDCNGGLSNWKLKEGTLNSGNNTEFTIEFRSNGSTASGGWGDDFCIDDIVVYQIPKACGQVVSTTQVVAANGQDIPAFTVSKTYDCATGKGGFTVTPTATAGFTYTYTLGSTTYTSTTATFTGLNLEQTYTVTVNYQAVSNTVTLLNEDFGTGTDAVKSPYIGKDWYFNNNTTASYTTTNGKGQTKAHLANRYLENQEYTVASAFILNSNSNDWMVPADRSGDANGRKLFIDGHATLTPQADVYLREVSVLPNKPLTFTTALFNVISITKTPGVNNPAFQPQVRLQLYESEKAFNDGNAPVKESNIYRVAAGSGTSAADWKTHTLTLSSTEVGSRTKLFAVIRMYNLQHNGHDLAVDDIIITQSLGACTTSVTTTLTKGDVATPTLTLPANLSVICSAPTASATISSWIASATATSTCGTATVTHNYSYPSNLCNVGGAVTVTFSTTDPFGNVVTATRVISFATMTLTVTPTTLSVPNGALGGTTSSVVPNITLGGVASPSTNSVTITFSGLPAGVTTDTQGRLVIAPNTPATDTTISYRVCEKVNPSNCQTANTRLVIGTGSLTVTPTPMNLANGNAGGTTTPSVLTGVVLNGQPVTDTTSVTLTWNTVPPGATGNNNGTVTVAPNTPAGTYTVSYTVCERLNSTSNCETITSTLTIGTGSLTVTPVTPLTVPNGALGGTTTQSILTGVTLNGTPNPSVNSVTISFSGLPAGVTTDTQGRLVVAPNTPATDTTISYRVCEKVNPSNCQTANTRLVIGTGSLTVTPTPMNLANGNAGGTTTPSVLTGVVLNGQPVTDTTSVTLTWNSLPPGATGNNNGTVTVAPNTPAGTYTVSYTVCERLNSTSNCNTVTSTLTIGTGSLTVTPVTPLTVPNGALGGTTTQSILTGVTLNGTPNPSVNSVTITFSGLPAGVTTDTQGRLVIAPNTPATDTTISYRVCEKVNPSNCQTANTRLVIGTGSLTVTPTPMTLPNGNAGGTTTPSVLTGVVLNGQPVTDTTSVTLTWNSLPPGATGNNNGTVTVAPNTPAGTYTVSYTVCERLNSASNNCKTVTSTLTIAPNALTVESDTFTVTPNGTGTQTTP